METKIRPEGWEVDADEYLGLSDDGWKHYRIKDQVYRQRDGYTHWICTMPAFPQAKKLWNIAI